MKLDPIQPATDDPALAAVLGANENSTSQQQNDNSQSGLQFEEAPITGAPSTPELTEPEMNIPGLEAAVANLNPSTDVPMEPSSPMPDSLPAPAVETPSESSAASVSTPAASGDLEDIKKDALSELRPLVDRLELPADEKFDIMLLIIRSNDDKSLLKSAHETAKLITDDTRRAQALLDVVKEIDYFAAQS